MGSVNIIVNADDLGLSDTVNEAIFELMAESRISSATMMANAPATRRAAARIKRFERCSFGIHLNLTQFAPIADGPGRRLLVDGSGEMSRAIETAPPTIDRLKAIYDELCAQVELLASLGVPISHLDSHNHVHTVPYVFPALKAVQRRYRIRKVRITKNVYTAAQPCPPVLWWKKRTYNWALRHVYRTDTTEAFTELLSYCEATRAADLPFRTIELMVHPGAANAAEETAVLKSDWLRSRPTPVKMITYHELGAGR